MSAVEVASLRRETEVSEKAKRRTFTAEYKRQIVKEADACKAAGEVGALLRREGLYSSHPTTWRAAPDRGELAPGAVTKNRGPRAAAAGLRGSARSSTPGRTAAPSSSGTTASTAAVASAWSSLTSCTTVSPRPDEASASPSCSAPGPSTPSAFLKGVPFRPRCPP